MGILSFLMEANFIISCLFSWKIKPILNEIFSMEKIAHRRVNSSCKSHAYLHQCESEELHHNDLLLPDLSGLASNPLIFVES